MYDVGNIFLNIFIRNKSYNSFSFYQLILSQQCETYQCSLHCCNWNHNHSMCFNVHPLHWCMNIKLCSQIQIYPCQRPDRIEIDRCELIVVVCSVSAPPHEPVKEEQQLFTLL